MAMYSIRFRWTADNQCGEMLTVEPIAYTDDEWVFTNGPVDSAVNVMVRADSEDEAVTIARERGMEHVRRQRGEDD